MKLNQTALQPGQGATPVGSRYPQLFRRYAHIGYDRFDNALSDHVSVGSATIGKATVDCKFLFEKSHWGVLSQAKNPAGIIYLDLSFHQPPGHRLKSAKITVRLDEDHADSGISPLQPRSTIVRQVPLQIGTCGPTQIKGEPRRASITSRRIVNPGFDVPGIARFEGVSYESERHYEQEYQWTFSSLIRPDPKSKTSPFAYRILEWHLAENELETNSSHNNTIHTAFSFQHSGNPFLMHVSVKDQLQSRVSDMKYGMKNKAKNFKFGPSSSDIPEATTFINFGELHKFVKPLDELEKGLDFAMEQKNMRSIPVEIPASHHTTFREVPADEQAIQPGGIATLREGAPVQLQVNSINQQNVLESAQLGQITDVAESRPLKRITEDQNVVHNDPCLSNTENLSNAMLYLTDPRIVQPRDSRLSPASIEQNTWRVGRSRYTGAPSDTPKSQEESSSKDSSTTIAVDESTTLNGISTFHAPETETHPYPAIVSILQLTGLIKLMQMCVIFMSSWGIDISPPKPKMEGQAERKENDFNALAR